VKEAIEDGGGDGAIAVEDSGPLFKGFVGGDDDRTAFVALTDDLEEQVGSALEILSKVVYREQAHPSLNWLVRQLVRFVLLHRQI
jgi:hypothetical protein